jgi:hypothetical protein
MTGIMLDSGAFSAWQQDQEIELRDYVAFIRRHAGAIKHYVSLDVIPGQSGCMDWSKQAVERSAKQSYANLQIMKDRGLSPIPVFHQGENFGWLHRLLADGETYIGLSPYSKSTRRQIAAWLFSCFAILRDYPNVKTHAFGATSHLILDRFSWSSVDSATWRIQSYKAGAIVVPIKMGGVYDYRIPPDVISVTDDSTHRPRHFNRLDKFHKHCVTQYLRDAIGIDVAEARSSPSARLLCWVRYLHALAASRGIVAYFATNTTSSEQQEVLSRCRASRLLSFFELSQHTSSFDKYIHKGGGLEHSL